MTAPATGPGRTVLPAPPPTAGRRPSPAARGLTWLHLFLAWLPVWVLYSSLIAAAHGASLARAAIAGSRAVGIAALLGLLVQRFTDRLQWPRPLNVRFVAAHAFGALAFAGAWVGLVSLLERVVGGRWFLPPSGLFAFLILGAFLYFMVAGIAYAVRATERAARAEAAAATTQLAALRAQLNPHFLFNALHAVVQLIPVEPKRAAQAAEEVATLLRTVIEEDRDLIPLEDERRFVERYLEVERVRFGDRLQVRFDIDPSLGDALIPSFVVQTLVENAVRHGAAPQVEATAIVVSARATGERLILTVRDSGVGMAGLAPGGGEQVVVLPQSAGTGLRRLAERLEALYGRRAALSLASEPGRGFTAMVALPIERGEDA